MPRSVVGCLVIAAGAGVYLYKALKMPLGSVESPGVGFVPVLFGTGLLILCLALAGKEMLVARRGRADRKEPELNPARSNIGDLKRTSALILSFLLFPMALSNLGFLVATSALLLASLRILRYKSWVHSIVVSVAATFAAQFLFVHLLGVFLPTGLWWGR